MRNLRNLWLARAVLAVILMSPGVYVNASLVGRTYGDSLWIEKAPRNATPTVTVGDDDAYIAGTCEVDGNTRLDGTLTVAGLITATGGMGALACTTLSATSTGDIAGQFTWGTAGTKSTGSVTGSLTMPGTLTAARASLTYGVAAATGAFTGAVTGASFAATYGVTGATLAVTGASSFSGNVEVGAATKVSTWTASTGGLAMGGQLGLLAQTTTQMLTLTPAQAGALIWSSTNGEVAMSSGTGQGAWVILSTPSVSAIHD